MRKSVVDWWEVARMALLSRELDLLEEERLAPKGKINYQFFGQGA